MWSIAKHFLDRSRYELLSPATLWSCYQNRLFAAVRTKRYKTQRTKRKPGARRLVPAPTKPPRRTGKLGVHERKQEDLKKELSRVEIQQFAWNSGGGGGGGGKPREGMQLRRAEENVNPFESIPTFRKKSDSGPPPISMDKRKGSVTIRPVTFEERSRGARKVRKIGDQKKRLKRPRRPAQLRTDKRDEDD